MKPAQREVKHLVKEAKDSYRRKEGNNMRMVSESVRTITGLNTKTRGANKLNDFFYRFNLADVAKVILLLDVLIL